MPDAAEQQRIDEEQIVRAPPRGTWVIMLIFGILFTLAWLAMYFGLFLPRGAVS